jgi:lipopolysaccharide export system permease protein
MWIIYRYTIRELIGPFFFALGITTLILMLARIFKLVELIVAKSVPIMDVLNLFGYYLPAIIALTAPMSMLIAVLIGFGRLSSDNEVTAMKATGISLYQVVFPVLLMGFVLSIFMVWFNDQVLPEANHRFKNLLMDINMKRPDINLREQIFLDSFSGYQIYFNDVNPRPGGVEELMSKIPPDANKDWMPEEGLSNKASIGHGAVIYKLNGSQLENVITADTVYILTNFSKTYMYFFLFDAVVEKPDKKDPNTLVSITPSGFMVIILPTETEMVRRERDYRSDRELTLAEMYDKVDELKQSLAEVETAYKSKSYPTPTDTKRYEAQKKGVDLHINSFLVEIHKKFSIPLASMAFVFIGVPFGIMTRRSGKGVGIGISLFFFIVYYVLLVAGESFGDRGIVPPWFAMWLPNALLTGAGIWLLIRTVREQRTLTFDWLLVIVPPFLKKWWRKRQRKRRKTYDVELDKE